MYALDLEIYNGEPTDDAGVFWWCSLSPVYRLRGEPLSIVRTDRIEFAAIGYDVGIFPAYVEHLRALALRLTFDGFELQAEYEWSKGWYCDGPI